MNKLNFKLAKASRPRRQAFTLIEMLLVLAILGVLLTMAVPNLLGRQEVANVDITRGSIAGVKQALRMYQLDHHGQVPDAREGLQGLVEKVDSDDRRWRGPYLEEFPEDAWGQPLKYVVPGKHNKLYDLVSAGPDQVQGTDDDIGNWNE